GGLVAGRAVLRSATPGNKRRQLAGVGLLRLLVRLGTALQPLLRPTRRLRRGLRLRRDELEQLSRVRFEGLFVVPRHALRHLRDLLRSGVLRGQSLGDLPPQQLGLRLLGTGLVGLVRLLQALRLRLVGVLVLLELGGDLAEAGLVLAREPLPLLRLGLPVGGVLLRGLLRLLSLGRALFLRDSVGEQLLRLVVGEVEVVGLVLRVVCHCGVLPLRACESPGAVSALRGSTAWSGGRLDRSVGVPGLRDQVHQAQLAGPTDDEPAHLAPTRLATLRATHGTDGLEQVGAVADREPAAAALRVRQRLALLGQTATGLGVRSSHRLLLGDLCATSLTLQAPIEPLPLADRLLTRVLAADVLVPQTAELASAPGPRRRLVVHRFGGAGAVVVRLELRRSLRLVADNPPAGEHRAERTRVTVGHPYPPDDLPVLLQQREQALAPAGQHVPRGRAGRLDEAVALVLLPALAAAPLVLLAERAGDVERDLRGPVLTAPIDFRHLEGDPAPAPVAVLGPLQRPPIEVEPHPGVARLGDHQRAFTPGARPRRRPLSLASFAPDARTRPARCGRRGGRVDADGRQLSLAEPPVVVRRGLGRLLPVPANQVHHRADPTRSGLVEPVRIQQHPQGDELGQERVPHVLLCEAMLLAEAPPLRRPRHGVPPARTLARGRTPSAAVPAAAACA